MRKNLILSWRHSQVKSPGNSIIIKPRIGRIQTFTDKEINQWLKDDQLPKLTAVWSDIPDYVFIDTSVLFSACLSKIGA